MRNETNDLLNGIVKKLTDIQGGTDPALSMSMFELIGRVSRTEEDLHDCVNELCLKCGQYREQHKGACDGCRWLTVKEGFR